MMTCNKPCSVQTNWPCLGITSAQCQLFCPASQRARLVLATGRALHAPNVARLPLQGGRFGASGRPATVRWPYRKLAQGH